MRHGLAPRKRRRRKRAEGEHLEPLAVDDAVTGELFAAADSATSRTGRAEFVIDLPVIEGASEPLPRHPQLPQRRVLSRHD